LNDGISNTFDQMKQYQNIPDAPKNLRWELSQLTIKMGKN